MMSRGLVGRLGIIMLRFYWSSIVKAVDSKWNVDVDVETEK